MKKLIEFEGEVMTEDALKRKSQDISFWMERVRIEHIKNKRLIDIIKSIKEIACGETYPILHDTEALSQIRQRILDSNFE